MDAVVEAGPDAVVEVAGSGVGGRGGGASVPDGARVVGVLVAAADDLVAVDEELEVSLHQRGGNRDGDGRPGLLG